MTKESFTMWSVICTVLMIWCVFSAIRLAYRVIRSRKMLRALRKDNETVVRGISMQYQAAAYLITCALELFGVIFFAFMFLRALPLSGWTAALVGVLCVSTLVTLIIHLVALFQEKHVYLTKNGLITYVDCHSFSSCRFAWENNDGGMSDMLHVYNKKDKMPFTVQFDGDIAAAHALTEQYASDKPTA